MFDRKIRMVTQHRIPELDYMKGIAIILVIMGHIVQFSMLIHNSAVVNLFAIFHMPIFFAVSGFLSYKETENLDLSDFIKRFLKRSRVLLLPLVVWSVLYNIAEGNIQHVSYYRGEYWFFLALWWCDMLNEFVLYISKKIKNGLAVDFILYGTIYALLVLCRVKNFNADGFLPIQNVQYYFPFFVLGNFMKKKLTIFRFFLNQYSYAIAFAIVIAGWYFSYLQSYMLFAISGLGAIILTWMVCREINPGTKWAKYLSVAGKNTLPLYAIHYLFIAILPQTFHDMANVSMGFFFQFVIAFVYAAMVILLCLIMDRIISLNPITRMLLFGESKKRKW